jgi:glutathione S-transferase
MDSLTLVVGSKNFSSWSLRPWLALKEANVPFREVVVQLDRPDSKAAILRWSPSGKVPVLHHGARVIWDSLAIVEYVHELQPDRGLWPADAETRALARCVSAEMHSSFTALRTYCPMDLHHKRPGAGDGPGVERDVERIHAIWSECLARSGGPFLFGAFCAADAFYAPVVTRFRTYGKAMPASLSAYADRVWNLPTMQEWVDAARGEEA